MDERTYIVTYIAADGQTRTDSIVGRNHRAVERIIKNRGGKMVHLERDVVMSPQTRSFRHIVFSIVLFILAALVIIAFYWWHERSRL